MIRGKKGGVILLIVIFGLLAALATFIIITTNPPEARVFKGEMQLKLIDTYIEAEGKRFYVDQAAKYALEEANKEAINKEGEIIDYMDNYLQPYLQNAPHGKKGINQEYVYSVVDGYLIGKVKENPNFPVLNYLNFYRPAPGRIEYSVQPNFRVSLN